MGLLVNMIISKGDLEFLQNAMARLRIRRQIRVYKSDSKAKFPDIWMYDKPIGEIWVTDEWAKQSTHERRKRLLHEIFHFAGLEHGRHGGLEYSTHPNRDTFSEYKYREMIASNPKR